MVSYIALFPYDSVQTSRLNLNISILQGLTQMFYSSSFLFICTKLFYSVINTKKVVKRTSNWPRFNAFQNFNSNSSVPTFSDVFQKHNLLHVLNRFDKSLAWEFLYAQPYQINRTFSIRDVYNYVNTRKRHLMTDPLRVWPEQKIPPNFKTFRALHLPELLHVTSSSRDTWNPHRWSTMPCLR